MPSLVLGASQIFVGTIIKKGEPVVFSNGNRTIYEIDDVIEARQLAGKRFGLLAS